MTDRDRRVRTTRRDPSFYRGEYRHNGLDTVRPVNHAGAYRTTPGFRLVAAANQGEAKLRAFGERWGVRALDTDVRQMLREERPEIGASGRPVVSVCTQSPAKAEADAMITACERNGVFLAVNHPNRFSLTNRKVKALIDGGTIGQLGTVAGYSVSGMLHGGTHTFDMLQYLAGDVVEIWARVPSYTPEKDLPVTASLWFANGVAGFVDHTHQIPPGFEARGTAGYLTTSTSVGDGWLYRVQPFQPTDARAYPNRLTVEPIEAEPHTLSPTQQLLAELYQTLTDGAPFASTGRDGAAALELGIACYASHLAGGPIPLPLAERTLRIPNRSRVRDWPALPRSARGGSDDQGYLAAGVVAAGGDGVSFDAATFQLLVTGALWWSKIAGIRPGETVAILGQGLVGNLLLQASRAYQPGRIVAVDALAARCAVARRFGADLVIDAMAEDPVAVVREITADKGVDLVVDCATSALLWPPSSRPHLSQKGSSHWSGRVAERRKCRQAGRVQGGHACRHLPPQLPQRRRRRTLGADRPAPGPAPWIGAPTPPSGSGDLLGRRSLCSASIRTRP